MKNYLKQVFSRRGAVSRQEAAATSFPFDYYKLHVEDRRNIVAAVAKNIDNGAQQANNALRAMKVVLFYPDTDPLVRWNIAVAAMNAATKFPELRRQAHNVLNMIVQNPIPGDEPELYLLIDRARESAPVPRASKTL